MCNHERGSHRYYVRINIGIEVWTCKNDRESVDMMSCSVSNLRYSAVNLVGKKSPLRHDGGQKILYVMINYTTYTCQFSPRSWMAEGAQ